MVADPLLEAFPSLARGGYTVTSPKNRDYNCIAWAPGDSRNWWWPEPADVNEIYWPTSATRAETVPAFQEAFASLGYSPCGTVDLEPNVEKIAIFANELGVPLHAARQRPDGRWTSKLGELEDIEHALYDLEGSAYGSVVLVMKRPLAVPS